MSSFTYFKTWEQIAEYIESVEGLKYLDNPTTWVNAFKDHVKNPVEVLNEITGETTPGFWTNIGEWKSVSPTSGVKNLPTVTNVVTDVATGGAVVGESATALEATGITIELTAAGYLATALTGIGLGVASYEIAPKFWTDLSNFVFDTDLTYEETEPFLRKKIKGLMAKDKNDGEIKTYIPKYITEKVYQFVQNHLSDGSGVIDFPTATWNPNNTINTGAVQTVTFNSLDSNLFKKIAYDTVHLASINNINLSLPSYSTIADIVIQACKQNDIRVGIDCDLYDVSFEGQIDAINTYGRYTYNVNLFKRESENIYLHERYPHGDGEYDFRYSTPVTTIYNNKPIATVYISFESGSVSSSGIILNYTIDSLLAGFYANTHLIRLEQHGYITTKITSVNVPTGEGEFDEYLNEAKATKIGYIPTRRGTFDTDYADWSSKSKKVSQPAKDGTNKQTDYLPTSTPIGKNNSNVDKIINNGVNQNDDSYNPSQEDVHNGTDPSKDSTIDDFNDSTQDVVDDYNDDLSEPFIDVDDVPKPTYPTNPPTDTDFEDTPDTPPTPDPPVIVGGTASGMVSVYNPTKQQIRDFSAWLWSDNFIDNFLKIFQNPMDAIIGLHILYAVPPTSGVDNIKVGYLTSPVVSKVVSKQYTEFDCGTVSVEEYFGNATDYAPYTKIYCYLPFIGIVPIKTDDVMGKLVNIKYGVDVLTGTCLATITVIQNGKSIAMYTFTGNCAVQLPLSGGNYSRVITSLVGVVGSAMVGGAVGAIGAVGSALSSKLDVQHSGSIGSNAGAMGIRNPYLIITRTSSYDANGYSNFYGFPSNTTVRLSQCKGFTRIKDVHIDTISNATDNEKLNIESLLKKGVIIN